MSRKVASAPGSANILGAGAAFTVSILAGAIGSWIESTWNTTVVGWEMAGLIVCVLVTVCGVFVGAGAAIIRRVVIGTGVGAVVVGACLAAISLTNGSARGVALWSIAVGVCCGATAGAVGSVVGRRNRKQSDQSCDRV